MPSMFGTIWPIPPAVSTAARNANHGPILRPLGAPPLTLFENAGVVWAIPAASTGRNSTPFPIGFTSAGTFNNFCGTFNSPLLGWSYALWPTNYKPPYSPAEFPGWNLNLGTSTGNNPFSLFCAAPASLPFAQQFLRSLGVEVSATLGPAYTGSLTAIRYVLLVPAASDPQNPLFVSPMLLGGN